MRCRFQDCFKLGKRIDEGPYLLPNPDILRPTPEDDLDYPVNAGLDGASSTSPQHHPRAPNPDRTRPAATVFSGHKIMLSEDLSIDGRLHNVLSSIVNDGGGKIVKTVDECDTFICQFRDGQDYVSAAQGCKDVGNLSWLYHLIINNEWTSPFRRLLHYPVPKNGIAGFKGKRITISNYGGEARIYLENLVKACGAEYTRTMNPENTHLITARNTSEKCKAAPDWGIAVVNHLWIEECYAKCESRPINLEKYNHFPPRTNLGEIIGQTFQDESRIRELFYPGGEKTMSPRAKRKRKILEAAEENAYQHGPAEGVVIGLADGDDDDFEVMRDEKEQPKRRSTREMVTPARNRRAPGGKENDTPTTASTGSRSAKAKARDMLQYIAPDIALYEKEKKRQSKSGASPWGGKRAADLTEREEAAKNSAQKPRGDEDGKRPAKKSRPSVPEVEMRIVTTGHAAWVGDQKRQDSDRVCIIHLT